MTSSIRDSGESVSSGLDLRAHRPFEALLGGSLSFVASDFVFFFELHDTEHERPEGLRKHEPKMKRSADRLRRALRSVLGPRLQR
jgi:hypothetical protein